MIKDRYPYYLGNQPIESDTKLPVHNKYTGRQATCVSLANRKALDQAIDLAKKAFLRLRRTPSYERQQILYRITDGIRERTEELAHILSVEVGKPIKDARVEVQRAIETFRIAAEEAVRIYGEVIPLDTSPRARGYQGLWKRFPVGPCAFITPFNFPLNLAAHKVAPAIACGCPFVLKPASSTPISAIVLGEIMAGAGLPDGSFSVLPCRREDAEWLVADERIKHLSFTGSADVGWQLKTKAGKKSVVLELGGNAGCIVDEDADIEYAAQRIMTGAFYQSGQSCISVQRILAHQKIYEALKKRLADLAAGLKYGDPLAEETFLGPLISIDDAMRIESWVNEALQAGAKLVVGGKRHGPCYEATILEGVSRNQKVYCQEIFGPVATLEPFSDFRTACEIVNDSAYGLQAGVFTRNLHHAFYAFHELEVGGVIINDIPSFRVDSMPYGGVKDSGIGREGVRYAIESMTEMRLMVLNKPHEID